MAGNSYQKSLFLFSWAAPTLGISLTSQNTRCVLSSVPLHVPWNYELDSLLHPFYKDRMVNTRYFQMFPYLFYVPLSFCNDLGSKCLTRVQNQLDLGSITELLIKWDKSLNLQRKKKKKSEQQLLLQGEDFFLFPERKKKLIICLWPDSKTITKPWLSMNWITKHKNERFFFSPKANSFCIFVHTFRWLLLVFHHVIDFESPTESFRVLE